MQNKAQLRAKYGADSAEDIFDNTGSEIVFGTNDLRLTKELSERMGDDTIDIVTLNRPRFLSWFNPARQSEAEHPHRRPLMLAQEVARLPPDEQIILRAGMLPMKTKRARWYDDPHFTSLVRPPPEIPRLNITVTLDDGAQIAKPRERSRTLTAADVTPETEEVE